MDGGDGCTILRIMPLNCTLKIGYNSKFYVMYILPQQKNEGGVALSNTNTM